jgi:hypothetical protein
MRGKLSAYCWLPLDRVIYTGMDAALEDGVEKLYVSAAAFLSRHPSVANYLTVDLTILKAMSEELAALFGLTFPDSIISRHELSPLV